MVQILPYVQSPLEQLMPHISQTAGFIGQGVGQHFRNKADQTILSQLRSGSLSPSNYQTAWSKLSPEAQKREQPFLESHLRMQEAQNKQDIKSKAKAEEMKVEQTGLSNTFESLDKNLDITGYGPINYIARKIPGTETFERAKRFDAEGLLAADKVYTHFNKGTVSDKKLKFLVDKWAPNSELPQGENRARIQALRTAMNLPSDISEQKFDAAVKKIEKDSGISESPKSERPPLTSFYK